jgi:hypothetical protein
LLQERAGVGGGGKEKKKKRPHPGRDKGHLHRDREDRLLKTDT